MLNGKLVTCNACGWVHMGVTRDYAENQVDEFNTWLGGQSPEIVESYGGESNMYLYEHCASCDGPYTEFRDMVDGDCPDGCTIGPVLHYSEARNEHDSSR